MKIKLDAHEVLNCLSELGYNNITPIQLKEFMKDLKKLIKYEQKQNRMIERVSEEVINCLNPSVEAQESKQKDPLKEVVKVEVTKLERRYCNCENHLANNSQSKPRHPNILLKDGKPIDDREDSQYPHQIQIDIQNETGISHCVGQDSNYHESCMEKLRHLEKWINDINEGKYHQKNGANVEEKTKHSYKNVFSEGRKDDIHVMVKSGSDQRENKSKSSKSKASLKSYPSSKVAKCDPVALYHFYQEQWKKHTVPGEKDYSKLRQSIRRKLIAEKCQTVFFTKYPNKWKTARPSTI